MERRLAAVLAADMVGYSRLMEADDVGVLSRQKDHRKELVDPEIARRRGRIVKTTGDGLLAEFASAQDAVSCAIGIQKGMTEREAGQDDDWRIQYRVGVNLGDVVFVRRGRYLRRRCERRRAAGRAGGAWRRLHI